MKWFRHMTGAWDDEKLASLTQSGGLAAYGFYWRMIEIIACQMKAGSECTSVKYPVKKWCMLLGVRKPVFVRLLQQCCNNNLLLSEYCRNTDEATAKVDCPKLLKIRDNWTREVARTVQQETETDTDTDTETTERDISAREEISGTESEKPKTPQKPCDDQKEPGGYKDTTEGQKVAPRTQDCEIEAVAVVVSGDIERVAFETYGAAPITYLRQWLDVHDEKWVLEAMKRTQSAGAKNARYTEKILHEWKRNGYPETGKNENTGRRGRKTGARGRQSGESSGDWKTGDTF